MSRENLPSAFDLNRAFGCRVEVYPTFLKQLSDCAAKTLRNRFDETPSTPFFFAVVPGPDPEQSINHYVNNPPAPLGLQRVGFNVFTKATHSLYRYTNRITAGPLGGGNYLFEQLWKQYQF